MDGFASEVEVMRKRGANPRDVLEQIRSHRDECKEKGLVFAPDLGNTNKAAQPDSEEKDE